MLSGRRTGYIPDYPRIVNEKHFDRLLGLLEDQKIIKGGESFRQTLTINPTILTDVFPDSPVMQEEIFGPVLPILTCNSITEAVEFIRERPKPLALYLFTEDKKIRDRIFREVSFGGGCINDTLLRGLFTSSFRWSGFQRYGILSQSRF